MVGQDLAALNTSTNTAMSEMNHRSQEQRILTENEFIKPSKSNEKTPSDPSCCCCCCCYLRPRLVVKDTGRIVHVRLRGVKVRVCAEQLGDQGQHQGWMARTQELQTPEGGEEEESEPSEGGEGAESPTNSLPDGVAVGWILVEVLQQLQQSQLDTLFGGDVGETNQLMESFSDVPGGILEVDHLSQ